ncbi:MAG: tetratricopeptide repeat protein [Pirellulaceae bacterium]
MPIDPAAVRDIFLSVLEKQDDAARRACLDELCAENAELRRQVEVLLEAHQQTGRFLEQGALADAPTLDAPAPERPGTRIGPYKLLQQIGEGGMGVVYMAEQLEPVERRVALKIIKPGMDSQQVIGRFEAERQVLAMMDHPNIARVLDAGTTTAGRPYFVMELVNGIPITQFCDEQHLTARERLELCVPLCRAVQHAHQKGIIHRDLKPGNILVALYDERPVPKVIDFGVARAVSQRLTDRTMFTGLGQIVGTIEYMSPEQAQRNQLDIDTRSDIYSLGVVLYELLTGDTPFDKKRLRSAAFDELLRIIREEEPPRPSTKLSSSDTLPSVAANRKIEPARLSKLVRGELDWIVMKSLEKDRARRYETAGALAADIERFLHNERVLACPPSAAYRLRKFVRRNKQVLGTTVLLGLVVIASVVAVAGTVGWSMRDRLARQAAVEQEAAVAIQESERLLEKGLFADALSSVKRAEGILAGSGSDDVSNQLRELRRDIEMALQLDGIRLQRVVVDSGAESDPRTESAYLQAFRGYNIAIETLPEHVAVERIRSSRIREVLVSGLDDWLVLGSWKSADKRWQARLALVNAADPDPWRYRIRQTLDSRKRRAILDELAHPENAEHLTARNVWPLFHSPTVHEAPEQVLLILRTAWQQAPDDFWVNLGLGYSYHRSNPPQWHEAVRFYTAALAKRPESGFVLTNLGVCLLRGGKEEEAVACFKKCVEVAPVAQAYNNLGVYSAGQNKYDEAAAYFRKAIELKPNAGTHRLLGRVLANQGKSDEALASFLRSLELDPSDDQTDRELRQLLTVLGRLDEINSLYSRLNPEMALSRAQLAQHLEKQGMIDEAIHWYRRSIELEPDRWGRHVALGNLLRKQEQLDEAAASLGRAIELEPTNPWPHFCLGNVLHDQGRLDEAEKCQRKAIELDPTQWHQHFVVGKLLYERKRLDEAEMSFREAIALKPDRYGPHYCLGTVLCELGRLDEAEACQRRAIEIAPNLAGLQQALGLVLDKQGREDEAAACYLKALQLDPNSADTHYSLGRILKRQGKSEQSLEHYRKALELKPQTPEFESAIKDLEGSSTR